MIGIQYISVVATRCTRDRFCCIEHRVPMGSMQVVFRKSFAGTSYGQLETADEAPGDDRRKVITGTAFGTIPDTPVVWTWQRPRKKQNRPPKVRNASNAR